jgi:hypothetical protein
LQVHSCSPFLLMSKWGLLVLEVRAAWQVS